MMSVSTSKLNACVRMWDQSLRAAEVATLSNGSDDFADVIVVPQVKIAGKKSLTSQVRTRFNAVERQSKSLDKLIFQFGTTAAGRALIAAYQAARTIIDHGSDPTPPTPLPPAVIATRRNVSKALKFGGSQA